MTIICEKIRNLGLKISLSKTEVIIFTKRKVTVPENTVITIEGYLIKAQKCIKYLSLTIDQNWNFNHFNIIISKAEGMAFSLIRLIPNLRSPAERKRRLYANMIKSVVMYG